jgi:lipoyl(octanoyl) transferase
MVMIANQRALRALLLITFSDVMLITGYLRRRSSQRLPGGPTK